MTLPVYIHDGLTLDGYIAERAGMHGAVRFKYRIYLSQKRAEIITAIAKSTPSEGERYAAMAVESNVIEWDVVDLSGDKTKVLEIKADTILKLHPQVAHRIYRIVMADEPSDPQPGEEKTNNRLDPESEFAAILHGEHPEEAREKNLLEV